ncbi:YfbU family protein [Klebsiella oxytoca]|nr:YfbU family protein [Klebsiella oxytoca]
MKYTQQEKLQTLMLCEIFKALKIKDSFDPDLISKAIQSEQYWALDWEYPDLESGEDTPEEVSFFVDTFDMYEILNYTYDNFSDADKEEVAASIKHFKGKVSLSFPGFDGNNETKYITIGRLLKSMGRFNGSDDLIKNSHMPSVGIYKRMLEVFLEARANNWEHGAGISKQSFIDTLNARVHPDNR